MSGTECCQNLQSDYELSIADAEGIANTLNQAIDNAMNMTPPDVDLANQHAENLAEIEQAIALLEAEKSGASSGCGCWS